MDDVTIGELNRRIESMEGHMREQFRTVNDQFRTVTNAINSLSFVHIDRYAAEQRSIHHQMTAMQAEITELKEARQWQARAVVISFLFPIAVALIVAALIARGG